MMEKSEIVNKVRAALEYDPRVNLHRHLITIDYADGAVVLEGEVESIAAKKRALELAGRLRDPAACWTACA
jgi:osmotically-inducible protein OsmY